MSARVGDEVGRVAAVLGLTDVERRAPRTATLAIILGALVAFRPLSIDMCLPALPAMAAQFHAGASVVQLTLTSCVFGLGLGQLVVGPLSDTLGRRGPLLVGYTVFSVVCALAPSVTALVAFRLLQALSGSAGLVSPEPWSATCTPAARWPGSSRRFGSRRAENNA